MLALARYTLKGPYHAATIVGVLAILSVAFPLMLGNPALGAAVGMLLTYTVGALVGLIILTQGIQSGLRSIVVSIFGITVVAAVALQAPWLGISIGLAQWLPIVVLAQTLRTTNSLSLMLISGVALGIVAVIGQFLFWPELEASWVSLTLQVVAQVPQSELYQTAEFSDNIRLIVHWFFLVLAASAYMVFVSIALISRWLQARLAESDGYKKEFMSLSLGQGAALFALALLALSAWLMEDWLVSLAILVAAAFLFQGIAVVHAKMANSKYRQVVIGIFYALLLILPQVMAITVVTGVIDNWVNFRKSGKANNTLS